MVTMESFAQAFGFDVKPSDTWTTLGKVTAVSGNTLSVLLGGSSTATDCEAYCIAGVGDIVLVVITNGAARAVARKGGISDVLFIGGRVSGDFDDLETTGIYYTQNAMTANKPTTASMYAYILVLAFDNVVTQFVWNNNNAVYVRNKSGNPRTWGAWAQL